MSKGRVKKRLDATVDPVFARWRSKYPSFPGVNVCLDELKSAKGGLIDIICGELRDNSKENFRLFTEAYENETNYWVRLMLISAIVDAQLPEATSFLSELLSSEYSRYRELAVLGLSEIDTKESRTILSKTNIEEVNHE